MAETGHAELHITEEEARRIASLLRYAVSLNTTAGLLHPTERRLTTSTYRAVELAALVLEGRTLEEAIQEAGEAWTGSLEEDHRRALNVLRSTREALRSAMTGFLGPEQFTEYFEISQRQFLELIRSNMPKPPKTQEHLK